MDQGIREEWNDGIDEERLRFEEKGFVNPWINGILEYWNSENLFHHHSIIPSFQISFFPSPFLPISKVWK